MTKEMVLVIVLLLVGGSTIWQAVSFFLKNRIKLK